MGTQLLPANQRKSIPLIDGSQIGVPGVLEIFGGRATKYWNPVATGINGSAMTLDPDYSFSGRLLLLSRWLDVRGCSSFQFVMTRSAADAPNDKLHGLGMYIQYRDALGNTGRTGDYGVMTQKQMGSFTTIIKPAWAAYPWANTFGYQLVMAPVNPNSHISVMMGSAVRIWFTETTGTYRAGETFSLEIYGQSSPVTRHP